jgi:UDP-N-acetylglucosamine--N-acetylmuramyl-(pentapeptide) pyrophosphoryl-undecaprenol N-acetylglucosamine transferase
MIKKIIVTGTHLTPALELIHQLQQDKKTNWQINYIGRESNSNDPADISIESKIIPSLGVNFYPISCGKLDRRYLPNTIIGIPKTIKGFIQSLKLINQIKPDIIVSFGGYVSVPIVIISFFKKIKSITHEQTLTNSLTTKINSHFVTKIALSFNNPKQISQLPKDKIIVTGNLLRYQLFQKTKIPSFIQNSKLKIKN